MKQNPYHLRWSRCHHAYGMKKKSNSRTHIKNPASTCIDSIKMFMDGDRSISINNVTIVEYRENGPNKTREEDGKSQVASLISNRWVYIGFKNTFGINPEVVVRNFFNQHTI